MANDVKIRFKMIEDVTEKSKKVDSSLKKTESQTKKTTSAVKAMKSTWLQVSVAITGVVAAISGLIKAYGQQELAEKKLAAALRVTGQYTDDNFRSMKDFASQIQESTVYGDEYVMSLEQMALNMGLSADKAKEATQGALGLSSALGIDARSAIKGVTTALQGDFNLLSRYIPALRTTTDETEKLAILNKTLAQSFEVATSEADSFTGLQKQNANLLGDVSEKLGELIAIVGEDPMRNLNSSLKDTNTVLENLVIGFRGLKERFDEVSKDSPGVGYAIKGMLRALVPGLGPLSDAKNGLHLLANAMTIASDVKDKKKSFEELFAEIQSGTEDMRSLGDNASKTATAILLAAIETKDKLSGKEIGLEDAVSTAEALSQQVRDIISPEEIEPIKPEAILPDPEQVRLLVQAITKQVWGLANTQMEAFENISEIVDDKIKSDAEEMAQELQRLKDEYIAGAEVFSSAFESAFSSWITGAESLGKALEKSLVNAIAQISAKLAVSGIFKLLALIPVVGKAFAFVGSAVTASMPTPSSMASPMSIGGGAVPTPAGVAGGQTVVIQNYTGSPFAVSKQEEARGLAYNVNKELKRIARTTI